MPRAPRPRARITAAPDRSYERFALEAARARFFASLATQAERCAPDVAAAAARWRAERRALAALVIAAGFAAGLAFNFILHAPRLTVF